MGLFSRLFGGADPSAKWIPEKNLPIEIDLDSASLSGVRLGLRPESLSKLGAPTNPNASLEGIFTWGPLGLQATAVKGILTAYTVGFRLEEEGLAPYPGVILCEGRPLELGGASRPEDLQRQLGEPWHRYADPEDPQAEVTWFYERRGLEWEVEFLSTGLLAAIVLHSPPSLARPEARRLLRVDKPWPP